LITDKPSPITVPLKLAQKSDGDILSALFDQNVTRGALKNLITDKPSPITVPLKLSQIEKSDGDILSALFDQNVTRGALKNLITDKPSPITVPLKLAQKAGINYIAEDLNGHNVTKEHLKNLLTDRVAPITEHARDHVYQNLNQGEPVLVNPVLRADEVHNATLGLNITVGHDQLLLPQN
jgi:hypothetical protein